MSKPEDTLVLETTKGKVVIAMRPDLAPGHVAHIKKLVGEEFYDGIVFHRVIDGPDRLSAGHWDRWLGL
jgi:peptidylprolyl isomerase